MSETKIPWADEVWTQIPGFEDYYASESGQILSTKAKTPKVMSPIPAKDGHLYVFLYVHGKGRKQWVHQLILRTFVGEPPKGQECRHLDGDPSHNYFSNLAWGTRLENMQDIRRHGRQPEGENSVAHKLSAQDVIDIRKQYGTKTIRALGREYGVSHTVIRRAALGINWRGVKEGLAS